jgi:hypothetical protein
MSDQEKKQKAQQRSGYASSVNNFNIQTGSPINRDQDRYYVYPISSSLPPLVV